MNTVLSNITVYSIAHGIVDCACAATIFAIFSMNLLSLQSFGMLVLIYNILAFALQAPFGLLIDKFKIPVHSACFGALLVGAATLIVKNPFTAVSFAGVGNALFHVGGGVIALNLDPKKAALPGIYVAPGAIGLMVGGLIGKSGSFISWPFVIVLLFLCVLMFFISRPQINYAPKVKVDWFLLIILLLLLSIGIRGVVGLSLNLPWKENIGLLVVLTSGIFLGKALGGVLGDKFGWLKVGVLGLVVSAPLLSFFQSPVIVIVGAFFFNLTMPITLTAISNMMPRRSGLAFGLTTLALIIGALPTFTQFRSITSRTWFVFSAILISIAALHFGLSLYKKYLNEGF